MKDNLIDIRWFEGFEGFAVADPLGVLGLGVCTWSTSYFYLDRWGRTGWERTGVTDAVDNLIRGTPNQEDG
jgi:hypothetical protein